MAVNSLICVDVMLRIYSLTRFKAPKYSESGAGMNAVPCTAGFLVSVNDDLICHCSSKQYATGIVIYPSWPTQYLLTLNQTTSC